MEKGTHCKLQHLFLRWWANDKFLTSLQRQNCTLVRLDFRGTVANNYFKDLLHALESSTSLRDLGLNIAREDEASALVHSTGVLSRIMTLRVELTQTDECHTAWRILVSQGLTQSTCAIQFLDCSWVGGGEGKGDVVWPPLMQMNGQTSGQNMAASLRALKISFALYPDLAVHLAHYLNSPGASQLVFLQVDVELKRDKIGQNSGEWECANALSNNFSLCTFRCDWKNKEAEAHAASFIQRNQLYREAQLRNETEVKPNVAKLFLCGHPEAGKTTLGLALQSQLKKQSSMLGGLISGCWVQRASKPDIPRTRGMEFRSLAFKDINNKKLLVCDLAGQEEYHVFHHYFMNASSNDLFIVVCRVDDCTSNFEPFQRHLDYWLRFIVSHRSARTRSLATQDANQAPKVLVVVNFFEKHKSPDSIDSMTESWTSDLLTKFSQVLDFGADAEGANRKHQNLFGINARTTSGVNLLRQRLESLLKDFDNTARPIPKLCYDISAKLTTSCKRPSANWLFPCIFGDPVRNPQGAASLLTSYSDVWKMVENEIPGNINIQHKKVHAALKELHNQGFLIFFSPEENVEGDNGYSTGRQNMDPVSGQHDIMSSLVITDIGWFCSELVGSLLDANHIVEGKKIRAKGYSPEVPRKWKLPREDIKDMLRSQGCLEKHLDDILWYLQRLELCVYFESDGEGSSVSHGNNYLLFPALLKGNSIIYPKFGSATEFETTPVHLFGRRIRCRNSSIHLIPFGVFTRLQVKLHRHYAAHNESFLLNYGWVSFKRGNIGVVVRFGGDVYTSEAWESKQWIDILIFCPGYHAKMVTSVPADTNLQVAAGGGGHLRIPKMSHTGFDTLVDEIKSLIHATCHGAEFGGIPNVVLEECVLESKEAGSQAVPLSVIMEKVHKDGLQGSYQDWAINRPSTPLVDLLLPKEINCVMEEWLGALARIGEEFSPEHQQINGAGEHDDLIASSSTSSGAACKQQVEITGQFKELQKKMSAKWRGLERTLGDIRADVHTLGHKLREAQQYIIADCSTRLLRHELRADRAYPLFPYLVDVKGKLAPLKALFGRRAVVHFMCEWQEEGPHPVEGQPGKEVTLEVKKWVAKTARVLVPAVRLLCCLAKLAATAAISLPAGSILVPAPDANNLLSGLLQGDTSSEQLQNRLILSEALKALLGNLPTDVDYKNFVNQSVDGGAVLQEGDVKEVMQAILGHVKDLDMASDFKLHRVHLKDGVAGRTFWVCDRHVHNGTLVYPILGNPFQC